MRDITSSTLNAKMLKNEINLHHPDLNLHLLGKASQYLAS
jgi:hypothetical protein